MTPSRSMEEHPNGLNGAGDGVEIPLQQNAAALSVSPVVTPIAAGSDAVISNTKNGERTSPRFVEGNLAGGIGSGHVQQPAGTSHMQQGDPIKGLVGLHEATGSKGATMMCDLNMQTVPSSSRGSSSASLGCTMVQQEVYSLAHTMDGKLGTITVEDPMGSPTVQYEVEGEAQIGLKGGANLVHGSNLATMHDPNMHVDLTM